jgi:hypothetical protein
MRIAITSWGCLCALAFGAFQPAAVLAAAGQLPPGVASGQRDFDFVIGAWKTRILHLGHAPSGGDRWTVWTGTVTAARVWGGRANVQQIEINSPSGRIEELRLCLYRPLAHQWYLYWADSSDGELDPPMIGRFKSGIGRFYDQEEIGGRAIFVRDLYSHVAARSYQWQQAFSSNGGATWQSNWRVTLSLDHSEHPLPLSPPHAATGVVRSHDFDFALGTWNSEISYLSDPFSSRRVTTRGRMNARELWGGRADLEEIEARAPQGAFQGLTLRLYDPHTRQWILYWANSDDGILHEPLIGEFKGGRGVFYGQNTYSGRVVFVRSVYFDIKPDSYRFAQGLSDDGGKDWRTDFTALVTRTTD